MAYDENLAHRVRTELARHTEVTERKMFGGLAFMVAGRMSCGVVGDELMVRVGPTRYDAALARAHVREMDFTGRPLRGMVFVSRDGLATASALRAWINEAVQAAQEDPAPAARRRGAEARSP